MPTLDNIDRLHEGEEIIRKESLRRIGERPDTAAHLVMIEQSMNLLHALLPTTEETDADQLTLGNLGIRCFNSLAACLKLGLAGYYQAAALHIRDLLEVAFLFDYLSIDAALVTEWRTLPDRDREKRFSPVVIRIALDKRDNFADEKRKAAYKLLCKLAGHATPEGAVMLAPDPSKGTVHCGPYLEMNTLHAVISEAALTAVQAAGEFRTLMKVDDVESLAVRLSFMHAEAAWLKRFYDREPDHAKLAQLREWLELARAQEAKSGKASE